MASCAFLWVRESLHPTETRGVFSSSSPGSFLCLSPALCHKRGPIQMTSVSSAHRGSQQELRWRRRVRSEHSLDSLLPQVVTVGLGHVPAPKVPAPKVPARPLPHLPLVCAHSWLLSMAPVPALSCVASGFCIGLLELP